MKRFLPDLPLVAAAAMLVVGGLLLLANLVLGAAQHGRTMKLVPGLTGVVYPQPLNFTWANVLNGRFESAFAHYVGPREPFYPSAVRLRDQLEDSLFNVSATASVVIGKDKELIEPRYMIEYCSRDVAAFMPGAPAWAAVIRRMQDIVQGRGKVFLYVLTPSKPAQYPGYMPAGWPCPAKPADRLGLVPAWLRVVTGAGVHMVDTTAVLWAAHGRYPFDLFPRGGTHWNNVGGALGAQAVQAGLQKLTGDKRFAPFSFTWRMSDEPTGTDIDLARLMNLIWPELRYPAPQITITEPPPAPGCRRPRIVIIGGSFMINIADALSLLPCGADVVEYEYWTFYHLTFKNGTLAKTAVDPAMRDRDLRAADVIIYEENEQLLGHSRHGPLLYRWLEGGGFGG